MSENEKRCGVLDREIGDEVRRGMGGFGGEPAFQPHQSLAFGISLLQLATFAIY